MRTRETSFMDETCLIIYITEDERKSPSIMEQINELKKMYKNNVAIFVSGKKDIKPVLKQMIYNKINHHN